MPIFDKTVKDTLLQKLDGLEQHFDADVVFYYGEIHHAYEKLFRDFIENRKSQNGTKEKLVIFLNTPGGSVESVEKMVDIIRYHYKEIYFIVPDYAMSAGTIFCMAGNKIFMDYSSSLGPIDPQVFNGKEYVPALGYLDQVEKLLDKSRKNTLTPAEFVILQNQDLALLSRYEQAKNLTITLLKKWLVEYKFANWKIHGTNPSKKGKKVTHKEKVERAKHIAVMLGDNKLWHSHGRMIGIKTLREIIKLEIDDYSSDDKLRNLICSYNDILIEYIVRSNFRIFLHSKNYF
ncbi:MAG: serine dehydrogenasease [Ignavibacteria bacterium CG1_02_37_35]|nr:MAG: serine dehydrogenasease [Ignavibacteria bacterium CG1_02_37_35]